MERALELLSGTDIAIKDIAGMVGYSSSNTFGRAFKRVYGTNATTIRMAERRE
jgi:two-component system response regulator YesN